MTIGIYRLDFKGTEKVYIGKSIHIEKRYKEHTYAMLNNAASKKVQEAYNLYGLPTLHIILECEECELDAAEMEAIELYNSAKNGFNSLDYPFYSYTKYGELSSAALYDNDMYIKILHMCAEGTQRTTISNQLNVPYHIVQAISSGTNHKWLHDMYPEVYEKVQAQKGVSRTAKGLGIEYPEIMDPEGNIYKVENVNAFAKEHGLEISGLHRVLIKERKTHKGWRLADASEPSKVYLVENPKVISPEGVVYSIPSRGVTSFCTEHGLSSTAFSKLLHGKQQHHKGWKIYNE